MNDITLSDEPYKIHTIVCDSVLYQEKREIALKDLYDQLDVNSMIKGVRYMKEIKGVVKEQKKTNKIKNSNKPLSYGRTMMAIWIKNESISDIVDSLKDSNVLIRIHHNGKINIVGIRNNQMITELFNRIINELKPCFSHFNISLDTESIINNIKISHMMSNIRVGFSINRIKLTKLIENYYKLTTKNNYKNKSYAIKIIFTIETLPLTPTKFDLNFLQRTPNFRKDFKRNISINKNSVIDLKNVGTNYELHYIYSTFQNILLIEKYFIIPDNEIAILLRDLKDKLLLHQIDKTDFETLEDLLECDITLLVRLKNIKEDKEKREDQIITSILYKYLWRVRDFIFGQTEDLPYYTLQELRFIYGTLLLLEDLPFKKWILFKLRFSEKESILDKDTYETTCIKFFNIFMTAFINVPDTVIDETIGKRKDILMQNSQTLQDWLTTECDKRNIEIFLKNVLDVYII